MEDNGDENEDFGNDDSIRRKSMAAAFDEDAIRAKG